MIVTSKAPDQAETLRRLFSHKDAQVLPILAGRARHFQAAKWFAHLASSFVQAGERTLVVDAARAHVAAALGLSARHDLVHALQGECALTDVLLEAAPGLYVVPAGRAFDLASAPSLVAVDSSIVHKANLARALAGLAQAAACSRVLLLLTAEQGVLLPSECECVLPIVNTGTDSSVSARSVRNGVMTLRDAAGLMRALGTADFRLLFLGMNSDGVTTLAKQLGAGAEVFAQHLRMGSHALTAPDLVHVVRAAVGWRCVPLATVATECMS